MASEQLRGHLAIAAAYSIFGLNVVLCKDIANSAVVSPYVLFTLRAIGASALFWLVSIFQPEEKVEKGDLWQMALASFLGLFLTQMSFLVGITMATAIDSAIYIFTCVAGVLYAVKTYRKKMEACDNLIESLENE